MESMGPLMATAPREPGLGDCPARLTTLMRLPYFGRSDLMCVTVQTKYAISCGLRGGSRNGTDDFSLRSLSALKRFSGSSFVNRTSDLLLLRKGIIRPLIEC
jgi:hypothetical protein